MHRKADRDKPPMLKPTQGPEGEKLSARGLEVSVIRVY